MESFSQRRAQLRTRAHEVNDQLRDAKEHLRDRANVQVQEVKKSLHRRPLEGGGEWDHKDPVTWNEHQRLAAKTNGYATLANAISVTGAILTGYGIHKVSQHEYKKAVVYMGVGRMLDLVDGKVAQVTETCSDKGAAIDAGLDKVLAATALTCLVRSGDMSLPEALVHGATQAGIFRESVLTKNHGGVPNPSETGKKGATELWLRIGGLVLNSALSDGKHEVMAAQVGFASEVIGAMAISDNLQALVEYNTERLALAA